MIEARSAAPLLPLSFFRNRTVTAANLAMLLLGGPMFPMFVFLSLYMQQVLGYSAIKAGLAFLVIAGGLIASSGLAQGLVTRMGARLVLTAGLLGLAVAQVLFTCLPVAGHFTADLLPGFVIVAVALGLAFVGDVIASTVGVKPADAGLASGLINTSQQIGGAVGLAVDHHHRRQPHRRPAARGPPGRRGADRRVPRRVRRDQRAGAGRAGGGHPHSPCPACRRRWPDRPPPRPRPRGPWPWA